MTTGTIWTASGKMLTGWQKLDGKWILSVTHPAGWRPDGLKSTASGIISMAAVVMKTGWLETGGKWYFFQRRRCHADRLGQQWRQMVLYGCQRRDADRLAAKRRQLVLSGWRRRDADRFPDDWRGILYLLFGWRADFGQSAGICASAFDPGQCTQPAGTACP